MDISKVNSFNNIKKYDKLLLILVFSIILYTMAAIYNHVFVAIMSVTSYLTWHVIFEFASILISFSIFAITYFIYEESGNLRMILVGCAFLVMGFLDTFHALSFKGMSDFFLTNYTANRATTLWIFARTIGSLGFMSAIIIPEHITSTIKKRIFAGVTSLSSIVLFFLITYLPDLFPAMYLEGHGLTGIKIFMEYFIILIMAITFLLVTTEYKKTNSNRAYMFMIVLILSIFSEFAFTNYGSVYDAFNYIGHLYKVIAFLILYKGIYIENVSLPYIEMKKARQELKAYSDNLSDIVKQRTKELEGINNVLLTDIENAKEMQRCLLPLQMPQDTSVSFQAQYFAADHLSGDFYNVIKLDEDNIAIYLGDVSGHGVSAAMLTIFANQNNKPLREDYPEEIIEPGFVLKTIYKNFNKANFNMEKYIVMLYGIYNIKSKSFIYSSAGINVAPYIIKNTGQVIEMDIKGFPICKLGDQIMPFYEDRKIYLEIDDKILFYSDGLIDAKNKKGQMFEQDRLKDFLKKNYHLNSSDLDIAIKNNLFNHVGQDGKLEDDVTYLIMQVNS